MFLDTKGPWGMVALECVASLQIFAGMAKGVSLTGVNSWGWVKCFWSTIGGGLGFCGGECCFDQKFFKVFWSSISYHGVISIEGGQEWIREEVLFPKFLNILWRCWRFRW